MKDSKMVPIYGVIFILTSAFMIFAFLLTLTLTGCNSSNSSSAGGNSPTAIAATPAPIVTPTPTPTPTSTPIPLTIPQKMQMLLLDNTFVTLSPSQIETPIIISSNQTIGNVSEDPSWEYSTFNIIGLTIQSGTLSHDETFYLQAQGTITISAAGGYIPDPVYENIASGSLYFTISNVDTGPFGVSPFSVFVSGPQYSNPGSYSITTGCGIFELYTDQAMTDRVSLLGNSVNCGLL